LKSEASKGALLAPLIGFNKIVVDRLGLISGLATTRDLWLNHEMAKAGGRLRADRAAWRVLVFFPEAARREANEAAPRSVRISEGSESAVCACRPDRSQNQ
jgi:hypothetical protein